MLLSKGAATLLALLSDDSVAVVKKAIQASTTLYRQAIISLARQQRISSPKVRLPNLVLSPSLI